MHEASLLTDLAAALAAAFAGGFLARLFRLPPIIGYLAAGIAISPFTPGYVADVGTVGQVAELGESYLVTALGRGVGRHLFALAHNHDPRPVQPGRRRRSMVTVMAGLLRFVRDFDRAARKKYPAADTGELRPPCRLQ